MHSFTRRAALGLGLMALAGCAQVGITAGTMSRGNRKGFYPPLYPNETPELRALINKWADHYEIPRELIHRQAIRESTHNPAARNGPYYGLLQIHPQTARTMGGAETNKLIDAEIKELVENGLKRAQKILTEQEDKLHLLAQAMLEYETLTGEEIDKLMKDGKIDRPDEPKSAVTVKPVAGTAVPKAGKKFGGGAAPQGA